MSEKSEKEGKLMKTFKIGLFSLAVMFGIIQMGFTSNAMGMLDTTGVQVTEEDIVALDAILDDDFGTYEISSKEIIPVDSSEGKVQAVSTAVDGKVSEVNTDLQLTKYTVSSMEKNISNTTDIYVLTGTAKTSDKTTTDSGVTMTGSIGWVDNLGYNTNEYRFVSGSVSGSISGTYHYENGCRDLRYDADDFETSFYSTKGSGKTSGSFYLTFYGYAANGSKIEFNLWTSILD